MTKDLNTEPGSSPLREAGEVHPIFWEAMGRQSASVHTEIMAKALRALTVACERADSDEELPEHVDGSLLDDANRALDAYASALSSRLEGGFSPSSPKSEDTHRAPEAGVVGWQPIETAPKDGTRILAVGPEFGPVIVRWGWSEPFGDKPAWTTDSEGPGYSTEFSNEEVTHWVPLPAAPDTAASSEQVGAAEADKGNHDCLAKRRPGEPMFILLGRDPDAHNIVRTWAERRRAAGGDTEHCQMGLDTAERMRVYASDPANAPASAPPASAYAPPEKGEGAVVVPVEAWSRFVGVSDMARAAAVVDGHDISLRVFAGMVDRLKDAARPQPVSTEEGK